MQFKICRTSLYMLLKWELYTLYNVHDKFRDNQYLNDI
jgi:hypothetical protein